MKKVLAFALLLLCLAQFTAFADEYVNGYTRSNGTYVAGYNRSSPNNTQMDNFSTQGNVNPYTGEAGHRRAAY
jgi:hypothetical protein